jgi:SAM-dependent methyltransferase
MKYARSNVRWGAELNVPHIYNLYKKLGYLKGNVLDLGCSKGWFVNACLNDGIEAFGVDIDEDVEYNKRIKKCDLNRDKIPFKDNTFDFVQGHAVVEHISNVHNMMKELKRVIKPDGKLVLLTYILNWRRRNVFWDDATHVRPYPPVALDQLFRMYDFKVILCEPKFGGMTWLWKLPRSVKFRMGNNYLIVGKNKK